MAKASRQSRRQLIARGRKSGGEWGAKQKKEYILDEQGGKIYDKKMRQYKCKSIPSTDWNDQTKAEEWRAAWAEYVNGALEKNNHTERIDHRSYERQGIDQIPTIHLGAAASQMERRGIATERGKLNREIEVTNQLNQRYVTLKDEVKEAEQIRKSVYSILRQEQREQVPRRTQETEL